MIRVVFLITSTCVGGAEMMLLKLLKNIDRKVYCPTVISMLAVGPVGEQIKKLDIEVFSLGMSPGAIKISSMLQLYRIMKDVNPDIVHTWMYHADLIGGLVARFAGIRTVIWSLRQSNLSAEVNKKSTLLVVKLCSVLSRVIPSGILSCSVKARQVHADYGYCARKIHVIPNGFDLKEFMPSETARDTLRAELHLKKDDQLVGFIARFDPQKNHIGFLKAAKIVVNSKSNVYFLLVGEGVDESNIVLMDAVSTRQLKDNLFALGRRSDVQKIMPALDLVVLPSLGEAFPNVIGEAMACEIPCVVTDVGDTAEIVADTGRVVSSEDMLEFATQMLDVLNLPVEVRRHMGRAARNRVEQEYDIKKVTYKYQKYYESLMGKVATESC